MDAIHAAIARHGNVWSLATNTEMTELYEPLHAARAPLFAESVRVDKGLRYGDDPRHRLDVYRPAGAGEGGAGALPVVVFFHGGGYTAGDNDITPSMHGNIGTYFASNGCVCVLATYRLLPEARHPSGGQDAAAALQWVQAHAAAYGGDAARITAVGQSAGGAHLAHAVLGGHVRAAGVALAGVALLSPPLAYDLRQPRRRANMFRYYGTDDEAAVLAQAGVAALRAAADADVAALARRLLLMVAELDSDEIVDANLAFVAAYRERLHRMPRFEVMMGHNHISNTLAIGLPGDAVGARLLEFVAGK